SMKISTKGRYGLRAMMDIAMYGQNGLPVLLPDIVKRQDISGKYLEQIFSTLHGAGLVNTVRGRKGGYLLTRPPHKIRLKEIITVLEGPCILVDCVTDQAACPKSDKCAARDIWTLLSNKMDELLTGFTLADIVKMQNEKNGSESSMYHI
ncbi:MAG: RrF2 family transcriptional regulator, partial [Syntrophorhabdales bacterium]